MGETNRIFALQGGHALRRATALLLALLLMVCGLSVSATTAGPAVPDPTTDFYVYDAASVLSSETENAILERNAELDSHYGIQIVVMTVTTLGGGDWEKYAQDVYAAWEIGGVQNRGLLLVLYTADDQYWSIAGALGPNFTDDGVGKLLGEYLEPSFAEKDYDAGVLAYFNAAATLAEQYVSGEAAAASSAPKEENSAATGSAGETSSAASDEKGDAAPTSAPSKTNNKTESKHPFLKFLAGLFTVILILLALAAAAFAVIYIRGQMIRRKRRAQRAARRSRSGSSTRGGGDDLTTPTISNDDYKSFSDRY